MPDRIDPLPTLLGLRWKRIDFNLRFQPRKPRPKHLGAGGGSPLNRLNGLCMYSMPPKLKPTSDGMPRGFLFAPNQPLGQRLVPGHNYSFRVLLPESVTHTDCQDIIQRFQQHLGHKLANQKVPDTAEPDLDWKLLTEPSLRERSLEGLLEGRSAPREIADICLHFSSPFLAWDPRQKAATPDRLQPWRLSAKDLGSRLNKRLEMFFCRKLPFCPSDWEQVTSLPSFWEEHDYRGQSSSGTGEWSLKGYAGPLLLRGDLSLLWPWLLLAEELPCGNQPRIAGGSCTLNSNTSLYLEKLHEPGLYATALNQLTERTDLQEDFLHALRDPQEIAHSLARTMKDGSFEPGESQAVFIPRHSGGEPRQLTILAPRDYVVHKALHLLLAPALDHAFEPSCIAYRPRIAPQEIERRIRSANREGCAWVLQADIEDFFDSIDHQLLSSALREALPLADAPLVSLIEALLQAPVRIKGKSQRPTRGLPQGSPLSPLLSNIFLNALDELCTTEGYRHFRFADDLLFLCSSREEALRAQAFLEKALEKLQLRLNPEKTQIRSLNEGYRFLGREYRENLDDHLVEKAAARRTLYVQDPSTWVGVDHEAVVVRARGQLLQRLPMRSLDGLVLLGSSGISSKAIERFNEWGLPIVFCAANARPYNILTPRNREAFDISRAQALRHEQLGKDGLLLLARRIVAAKIHNHRVTLLKKLSSQARATASELAKIENTLPSIDTMESLRGTEGQAAKLVFRALNQLVPTDWLSQAREPHLQADHWNSLLDLGSHLLSTHLHTLLLQKGLNPWLGWLHSSNDRYESLVYDLIEPFRAEMENMLIGLVNNRQVQTSDFVVDTSGRHRLCGEAIATVVQSWESLLMTRARGESHLLHHLMEAQVLSVRNWALDGDELRVWRAELRAHIRTRPQLSHEASTPIQAPSSSKYETTDENEASD